MKIERKTFFTCGDLPEKEKRNLTIFELIRKRGLISKPEIAKITGINIVSISNYIENYIAKKLVSEKGSDVSSGGRKPDLVELNRKERFVVGVDLGGGAVCATVCDLAGRSVTKIGPVAMAPGAVDGVPGTLDDVLGQLMRKAAFGIDALGAIGLGVGDGSFLPVGEALRKRLGVDVFVGGAAQCAAFGERTHNHAVEEDDLIYMHSDLGCGVVIKGCKCFSAPDLPEKTESWNGFSDERAYLKPWNPAFGVAASARSEVARGIGTKIVDVAAGRLENITTAAVIVAALKGDRVATDILRTAGINLGVRIAYLINVFGPRAVIIGGGIEEAGESVLAPLRNMVKRFAFTKQSGRVTIISGALGADAVSLGAASLAAREVFLRA